MKLSIPFFFSKIPLLPKKFTQMCIHIICHYTHVMLCLTHKLLYWKNGHRLSLLKFSIAQKIHPSAYPYKMSLYSFDAMPEAYTLVLEKWA